MFWMAKVSEIYWKCTLKSMKNYGHDKVILILEVVQQTEQKVVVNIFEA